MLQAWWKVFPGLPGAQKVSYIGQLQSLDSNEVHADNYLKFPNGQLQSLDSNEVHADSYLKFPNGQLQSLDSIRC